MPSKVQKVVSGRRTLHTLKSKPTLTIAKKTARKTATKKAAKAATKTASKTSKTSTGCAHCFKKVCDFITKNASTTTPATEEDEYPGFYVEPDQLHDWIKALTTIVVTQERRSLV